MLASTYHTLANQPTGWAHGFLIAAVILFGAAAVLGVVAPVQQQLPAWRTYVIPLIALGLFCFAMGFLI